MTKWNRIAATLLLTSIGTPLVAQPEAILPVVSENATMVDKLGASARLDLAFTDEEGSSSTLSDLVSGQRPIVLNLGYFSCPNACGPIQRKIVDCMQNAELLPGRDLDILSLSIDEAEGPELSKPKRAAFVDALGAPEAGAFWRFLTGDASTIRTLTDSVGYRFERNTAVQQIDHPPVVVMLSPNGTVTRYLNGEVMTPVTFRRAVIEAGEGQVGTFLERILVSCLTYDPGTGVYQMTAMTIMQVGGALTVLALGAMIFVLWRRERRTRAAVPAT